MGDDDDFRRDDDVNRTDAEGRPVATTDETAGTDRSNTEYDQGREDERIAEERTRGT